MLYILIISLLFIIGFYFLFRWRAKHQIQQYEEQKIKDATDYYDKINQKDKDKWLHNIQEVQDKYRDEQLKLEALNYEIEQKKEFNESMLKMREEELERIMDTKRAAANEILEKEMNDITNQIQEWTLSAQEAANENQRGYRAQLQLETEITEKELQQVRAYLDEYKEKQEAVNKEILRRRAIEEKEDFYRIQLDDNSKSDIEILNNIRQRLNKTDLLNKLIYENYIARPAKEMIKRVLGGKNPSGIYKVTNIKTNEIYIGKSVKIADRFSNHIKSAYGLEGVAESQFQRALKKYGIDMFTWELLEECPKENLSGREKYYIVFYGTKEYGYNQREG